MTKVAERPNYYDTEFARGILIGLQMKPVLYYGTVPEEEVQRRRAKNKVARKQRKLNKRG